jgi:hypothetical protein
VRRISITSDCPIRLNIEVPTDEEIRFDWAEYPDGDEEAESVELSTDTEIPGDTIRGVGFSSPPGVA